MTPCRTGVGSLRSGFLFGIGIRKILTLLGEISKHHLQVVVVPRGTVGVHYRFMRSRKPKRKPRKSTTAALVPGTQAYSARNQGLWDWRKSFEPKPVRWIVRNGIPQVSLIESHVMVRGDLASGDALVARDRKDVNASTSARTSRSITASAREGSSL